MVAKIWKNSLLFLLLIACLFNIVIKLVSKKGLNEELKASAYYIEQQEAKNNK